MVITEKERNWQKFKYRMFPFIIFIGIGIITNDLFGFFLFLLGFQIWITLLTNLEHSHHRFTGGELVWYMKKEYDLTNVTRGKVK